MKTNTETHNCKYAEWEFLEHSVLNEMSLSTSSPTRLRDLWGRGGIKILRIRSDRWRKESSSHNRNNENMNSKDCETVTQAYTGSSQTGSQNWEGEVDTGFHPDQEIILKRYSLTKKKKISFLQWSITGFINTH